MFKGLRIIVSDSAMRELMKYGMALENVIEVLEQGYGAPRKRKKDTLEQWLESGKKIFNAVVVKDYNEINKESCWVLIHFGCFTKRKK